MKRISAKPVRSQTKLYGADDRTANMKPARPEDIPQATHESVQEFFGVKVRTYVLDDGRRIINAEDFHKLMATMGLEPSEFIGGSD